MTFTRVRIAGFGYVLPPVVVATDEIEERLQPAYRALRIPAGQLEQLTGIHERRWWEPGYPLSRGAAIAAERALQSTGIASKDIDAVVYGSVCREDFEPATACHVAAAMHRAGLVLPEHAVIHDVSNACLGLVTAMLDVAHRIELGQIRAGLVVGCESAREVNEVAIARLVADPTMDRFKASVATFTGGSAAVAVVLTDDMLGGAHRLLGATVRSAPLHHELCRWTVRPESDAADPIYRVHAATDSAAVLEHGVALGTRTFAAFLHDRGWSASEIDRTVCHQIGTAHRDTMLGRLGLSLANDFVAYAHLGNTGTVALPLATALADERGFLEPGHRVALLGIGSGLNCIMLGVDW
jgi:3-oxoacyl-[acyl-carrier-protein] synthase III